MMPSGLWVEPPYRAVPVPDEGLYLLSETDSKIFAGPIYASLAPYLDQPIDREQVADQLEGRFERPVVHFALETLAAEGVLRENQEQSSRSSAELFWRDLGVGASDVRPRLREVSVGVSAVDPIDVTELVDRLQGLGISAESLDDPDRHDLHVVLTDDYLSERVAQLALGDLRRGRPWLLASTVGMTPWIGPLFSPGAACWKCLADRLKAHRPLDVYLSRRLGAPIETVRARARQPLAAALGLDLVAMQVTAWAAGLVPEEPTVSVLVPHEMSISHHVVTRRPQCLWCGDVELQTASMTNPVELSDDPHQAAHQVDPASLVDPVTGVVTAVVPAMTVSIEAIHVRSAVFGFERDAVNIDALRNAMLSQGAGVGTTERQAYEGAVFEAVERTSGMFHGDEPSLVTRFRDISPRDAIHPNACMQFSDTQYADRAAINAKGHTFEFVPVPFDEDALMHWTGVWSLSEQRFKLLPSTFLFYNHPQPPGGPYCWADSNGCAAGQTITDAIYRALLELIERDSVAIWWYNRLTRPGVELGALGDPYVETLVQSYERLDRDVWVLDVTSDLGIPTAAAVSRLRAASTEDILVAFAADMDMGAATRRALCEMNHLLPAVLPEGRTSAGGYRYPEPAQTTWWQTATLASEPYLSPDAFRPVGAQMTGVSRQSGVPGRLSELMRRVEGAGHEILVVNQTRLDIRVPVCKVIVPGLRHFWSRFAPGRLYDVPVKMGWRTEPLNESELNPTAMFL